MSQKGQDPQQPSGDKSDPSAPLGVQQSVSGIPGAEPKGPDPKSGSGSTPVAGGPNPEPGAIDAARQSALDNACVQVCTSTVQAYRMGTIDRTIAMHKLTVAIFHSGRTNFKHTAPWLKQLDDHDAACANAASVTQGGNPPPAGAVNGVPVKMTGASGTKRKRGNTDAVDPDSDSDSGDDNPRASRRAYNPAVAGFRKALLNSGPVSPHVQKTLDARDNYSADVKQAKRDVLRGGQCPPFPAELLDVVLCDNAVDFNKIYSARFSSTIGDGMQHRLADGIFIQIPARRAKKRIEDQSDWQLCFNSWFDVVCFLYPHRRAELLSYLEYVMDLFASLHKSFHDRVILADVHMRNTIHGDSRASFFDRDRLQSCALRFISPWGAEAGNSTPADADNDEDLVRDDEGDDFEEEFSTAEHSP